MVSLLELAAILAAAAVATAAVSFDTSGQNNACTTMMPTGDPNLTEMNSTDADEMYEISFEVTKYCVDTEFSFEIEAEKGNYFTSLFVEARCSNNCTMMDKALGMFKVPAQASAKFQTAHCHGTNNSVIKVVDNNDEQFRNEHEFKWSPPENLEDPVVFWATFVKDSMYLKVKSSEISVTNEQSECTVSGAVATSVVSLVLLTLGLLASNI